MKQAILTASIWLILLTVSIGSIYLYFTEKANSTRLFFDLKTINETAETFTTKDGHQASNKPAQELTARELKKVLPEMTAIIKNMSIKPRQVETFAQVKQGLTIKIEAPVIDTVIFTVTDTLKVKEMRYSDKWISINATMPSGTSGTNTGTINITGIDTIYTVIHKGARRRPWLWIFSKRQYEATASNRSPYIQATVLQAATIKH